VHVLAVVCLACMCSVDCQQARRCIAPVPGGSRSRTPCKQDEKKNQPTHAHAPTPKQAVRVTYTISAGVASRAAFQPQEGLRCTPGQKAIQERPGVANPKAKEEGLWQGHIPCCTPGVVYRHNKQTQTINRPAQNTTSLQLQLHSSACSRTTQPTWLLLFFDLAAATAGCSAGAAPQHHCCYTRPAPLQRGKTAAAALQLQDDAGLWAAGVC
jgi:hypothetical protein